MPLQRVFTIVLFLIAGTSLLFATGTAEMEPSAAGDRETVTITHDLGTTVVPSSPERPVAFGYDGLDILDSLDIAVGGIVPGTLPGYLDSYAGEEYFNAGSLFEPDFEGLFDFAPEVIVISPRQSTQYDALQEIAPTVYLSVEPGAYMDSVRNNTMLLARLYDREEAAESILAALERRIERLRDATEGKRALFIMVNDGSLSVYGRGSRFDVAYSTFGFDPADDTIEAATHGQSVSFEYLLEQDPDYLLVLDRGAAITGTGTAASVLDNAIVAQTRAARNDGIVFVSPQAWYLASGGLTATSMMIADIEQALGVE